MSDRRIAQELRRVALDLGDGEVPNELVSLSVGVLRGDVQMCHDYRPNIQALDVPISAIGWDGDLDVDQEDLAEAGYRAAVVARTASAIQRFSPK